ncbi:hypothetical protein PSTT_07162, partial [Puccinia striiformis]
RSSYLGWRIGRVWANPCGSLSAPLRSGRVRVGATHRGTAQLTRPASKRVAAGRRGSHAGRAGPGSYAFS